ncbi:MAG: PIN domain-containing protein [Anaerolineales bacterium]
MPDTNLHFLDASIWKYAVLEKGKAEKIESAQSLIAMQPAITSIHVIDDVCAELLKKGKGAEESIHNFIEDVFTNHRVVALDKDGYLTAADLQRDYHLKFHDSLIVAAALLSGAKMIYTDAFKPGLVFREMVHTINPFPKPGRPRK